MPSKLSLQQAAAMITGSKSPTAQDVLQVKRLIRQGSLQADRSHRETNRWTTTDVWVAEFMARRRFRMGMAEREQESQQAGARRAKSHDPLREKSLHAVYQEVLRDYFLAVIFRRDRSRHGTWFQGAVIAGQLAVLLLVAAGCVGAFRGVFQAAPAEHIAIQAWLEQNYEGRVQIVKVDPPAANPQGNGVLVRAEYWYSTLNRGRVHSEQYFIIQGDRVVSVESEL